MSEMFMVAVIIFSLTFLGYSFSQGIINRRKNLQGIIEALEKMQTYIGFSSFDVLRITAEVFKNIKGFEAFILPPESDVPFVCWWENCVGSIRKDTGLDKEDLDLLLRFSQGVGVSDAESQISHLNLYISLFKDRLKLAKDAEDKKARLYKILGFSLGCAVSLIVV